MSLTSCHCSTPHRSTSPPGVEGIIAQRSRGRQGLSRRRAAPTIHPSGSGEGVEASATAWLQAFHPQAGSEPSGARLAGPSSTYAGPTPRPELHWWPPRSASADAHSPNSSDATTVWATADLRSSLRASAIRRLRSPRTRITATIATPIQTLERTGRFGFTSAIASTRLHQGRPVRKRVST